MLTRMASASNGMESFLFIYSSRSIRDEDLRYCVGDDREEINTEAAGLGGVSVLLMLSRIDPLVEPFGRLVGRPDVYALALPDTNHRDDEEHC